VRLLGEDLVLFSTAPGQYGLIEEACPHRRMSLAYGMVEDEGIRCPYHGWKFSSEGRCLEMPGEPADAGFAGRMRAVTYPVRELGGLLFAYLGPEPAPLLPRWDVLVLEPAIRQIGLAVLSCNFFQIMENSVDPVHTEWLHGQQIRYRAEHNLGPGAVAAAQTRLAQRMRRRHVKIGFDPFEWGIIKRRVLEGGTEADDDWTVGHPLVFPNLLQLRHGHGLYETQYRVPIDDTHTLHIWYHVLKPDAAVAAQDRVPWFEMPVRDAAGEYLLDTINGQDVMAWETQGAVTDRSREHLGASDQGITLLRRMYREQIEKVSRGEDPLGVIRDPARNSVLELPMEKKLGLQGMPRMENLTFMGLGPEVNTPVFQAALDRMVTASAAAHAPAPAGELLTATSVAGTP
jgi:5,5'-dehydrodivanillate O-demethylase oxygenase subunit